MYICGTLYIYIHMQKISGGSTQDRICPCSLVGLSCKSLLAARLLFSLRSLSLRGLGEGLQHLSPFVGLLWATLPSNYGNTVGLKNQRMRPGINYKDKRRVPEQELGLTGSCQSRNSTAGLKGGTPTWHKA